MPDAAYSPPPPAPPAFTQPSTEIPYSSTQPPPPFLDPSAIERQNSLILGLLATMSTRMSAIEREQREIRATLHSLTSTLHSITSHLGIPTAPPTSQPTTSEPSVSPIPSPISPIRPATLPIPSHDSPIRSPPTFLPSSMDIVLYTPILATAFDRADATDAAIQHLLANVQSLCVSIKEIDAAGELERREEESVRTVVDGDYIDGDSIEESTDGEESVSSEESAD